jgi:hypothetical protein
LNLKTIVRLTSKINKEEEEDHRESEIKKKVGKIQLLQSGIHPKNYSVRDPDLKAAKTRSKYHVDNISVIHLDNEAVRRKPSTNTSQWTTVDYRRPKPKGTPNFLPKIGGLRHRRQISSCAHS